MGDVRPDRLPRISRFQYPDHLFFLSTTNIRSLLERTGFRLVRMYRYSIMPELFANSAARRIKRKARPASASSDSQDASEHPMSPLKARLAFWLRYRLGALSPIKDHHQTL